MDILLLASDAPTSPVDDAINSWFTPIATWFSSVIFVPHWLETPSVTPHWLIHSNESLLTAAKLSTKGRWQNR